MRLIGLTIASADGAFARRRRMWAVLTSHEISHHGPRGVRARGLANERRTMVSEAFRRPAEEKTTCS